MAGKGDKPRPVNKKKFDENYDAIFGPKKDRKKRKKNKKGNLKTFFKEIY